MLRRNEERRQHVFNGFVVSIKTRKTAAIYVASSPLLPRNLPLHPHRLTLLSGRTDGFSERHPSRPLCTFGEELP